MVEIPRPMFFSFFHFFIFFEIKLLINILRQAYFYIIIEFIRVLLKVLNN